MPAAARTFLPSHSGCAPLPSLGSPLIGSGGVLLAGWGLFVRLNRYAEELEPEAMADAKREDIKLK